PHMNLAEANANPDPYLENMYPNVEQGANKGIILEIRRERRIEMFNEGLRWDDLMRWKEGKKIEQPMIGIYFSGLGAHDFNGDGNAEIYLKHKDATSKPKEINKKKNIKQRPLMDSITGEIGTASSNLAPFPLGGSFDEPKDYFYPIPKEDLKLNENLEQNSGWKE